MFLNMSTPITIRKSKLVMFAAVLTGLMMAFLLVVSVWQTQAFGQHPEIVDQNIGLAKTLGKVLFNEYLIPFELTSILFISSMVGVVIFNKKEVEDE
ncbi:MAG: NADH-quinone oxidoreductase subunit J [Saprospiraceae bacterium]|nr:NADH-quinone oxidoreductase subunit J [Saprospiraceae bacterium]